METTLGGIRIALIIATAALLIVGIIGGIGAYMIKEALNALTASVDNHTEAVQKGKGEEK